MPIQDNLVNLYYVKNAQLPTDIDSNGIYFVEPTGELYVGSVLIANRSDARVQIDTTASWRKRSGTIAERNVLYIYSDYRQIDGRNVPGFKIGDGTSYLIDMPFSDEDILNHLKDTIVHITQEERLKWNKKVSVSISENDQNNLVFTEG